MSQNESKQSGHLSVPEEKRKSSLKKTSTDQTSSNLAVKGLGKRQKSFVQFDDNAIVINDDENQSTKGREKDGEKGRQNLKICSSYKTDITLATGSSEKSHKWTDSLKLNKKKFNSQEKYPKEKKN